jgi:DNA-binding HxlR family transcriptional regulator
MERSGYVRKGIDSGAGPMAAESEGLPAGCPVDRVLRLLWHEWTTHILWVLGSAGPTRFGQLQRRVEGISPKVLSARLRRMEEDGLVYREHEPTVPPKVTYGLTDRGREIDAVLRGLGEVGARWRRNAGA